MTDRRGLLVPALCERHTDGMVSKTRVVARANIRPGPVVTRPANSYALRRHLARFFPTKVDEECPFTA